LNLPVLTIGHSTRPIEDFIALLNGHGIQLLVDVRTIPRSRHNPQFNKETLPDSLHSAGIDYLHLSELGGLRHARKDSTNTAWRNLSFRGFADYMETPEFENGLTRLIEEARTRRVAIMCAEAVPWRCHRSMIADGLLARGVEVLEIATATRTQSHKLTPFARIQGSVVRYPALLDL
jgi:uncharacterized protein (DUF488 family)